MPGKILRRHPKRKAMRAKKGLAIPERGVGERDSPGFASAKLDD